MVQIALLVRVELVNVLFQQTKSENGLALKVMKLDVATQV